MANVLNTNKQIAIIAALSEGSSIRSIERMTGGRRDTIPLIMSTVLKIPPTVSPITAVRTAIMQELQEKRADGEPEAEA